MPIPGGVIALQQSLTFYPARRRSNSLVPNSTCDPEDPEQKAFIEAQRHYRENLKCIIAFDKEIISANVEKLHGVLVLETKREVMHSGLFILMKGLSLPPKKRKVRSIGAADGRAGGIIRKPVTSLKFIVLGNTLGSDQEEIVESGSKETYPLELDIPSSPDELPPPMVTAEGKLLYRLQAFMTTAEGRHVSVGESHLQYQGHYDLLENLEDSDKEINIQQVVNTKRSLMGLGRKKTVNVEFSVGRSGFLPSESVNFVVVGSSQEKSTTQLECRVELVQKVWYQVMPKVGRRMSVRMKVNLIAVTTANKLMIEPGNEVVWEGRLLIPEGQTPTYKFDFMNSVSYTLRVGFVVNGDKEGKVTAESPLYIGTGRDGEITKANDNDNSTAGTSHNGESPKGRYSNGADDDDDDDSDDTASPSRFAGAPLVMRPSESVAFVPCRRRAGSLSSVESLRSEIYIGRSSLLRLPPTYSQLSSRRSTLETLPPPYYELEMHEKAFEENGNGFTESIGRET